MIEKIEINGVHVDVDNDLHKYVAKKISHLDHFLPKSARESVHAQVMLKESKAKNKRQHTCEVILHVPGEMLTAKETTVNIYAAVDIVEARIKNQIIKYKETHLSPRFHRRVINRLKRQK